jgi:glycosyltransferase involved in cell wall biosynthesis
LLIPQRGSDNLHQHTGKSLRHASPDLKSGLVQSQLHAQHFVYSIQCVFSRAKFLVETITQLFFMVAFDHAQAVSLPRSFARKRAICPWMDRRCNLIRLFTGYCKIYPPPYRENLKLICPPLGFYYKGRVTKNLYRLFCEKSADLYIFEDIYLSWKVKPPAVTMLHAIWSDNLQAYNLSQKQINNLIRAEAMAINCINHPIATVSTRYRDYLINSHFAETGLTRKIEVIELGLDTEKFIPKCTPDKNRAIIYCGQ